MVGYSLLFFVMFLVDFWWSVRVKNVVSNCVANYLNSLMLVTGCCFRASSHFVVSPLNKRGNASIQRTQGLNACISEEKTAEKEVFAW